MRCLADVDEVVLISTAAAPDAEGIFLPGSVVTAAGLARSDRPVVLPVALPSGSDHPAMTEAPCTATYVDDGSDPERRVLTDPARAAVGTAVGAHLLLGAGVAVRTRAIQVGSVADPLLLAESIPAGRTALLVMADGAAGHGEHAPGTPDPRSDGFDRDVVTALRSGDPAALSRTCARLAGVADSLYARTLPALAAAAGLTVGLGRATARVLHHSAPFGVGYFVAVWQWS